MAEYELGSYEAEKLLSSIEDIESELDNYMIAAAEVNDVEFRKIFHKAKVKLKSVRVELIKQLFGEADIEMNLNL